MDVSALLAAQLREDAPKRERTIANVMASLGMSICVVCLAAVPTLGFNTAFRLSSLVGAGTAYYLVLILLLRRGWFRPWVSWVNVALEVTAPAVLLAVDVRVHGSLYAMTAPGLTIWSALVMTSALRANRVLAYLAGGLAAFEYLVVFFVWIHPDLPPDGPLTFSTGFAFMRGIFLFYAGVATASVAGHVLQKSEEAFRAIREQDLMGKYLLLDRIGAGGMAEVFRATYCPEGGFQKMVAVKRVLPAYAEDEEFVKLFREEARLGALLNHPNIVQVLDVGSYKGTYFLAMEYVEGASLQSLIAHMGRPLPLAAVSFLAIQLAQALDYAHARTSEDGEPLGLVHRDLNPPNVLVSRIGEVKLSDFGIARAASRSSVTRAGMVRGKVPYLAPEQATMQPYDGRADLFALGLTLTEALTGKPVADADSDQAIMRQLVEQDVPPASSLRADVPAALDEILAGLLQRDPSRRTPNGRALRLQLERLSGEAAPYPNGQALLAQAVKYARTQAEARKKQAAVTEIPVEGATQLNDAAPTRPVRRA
jgi:serine/threonine-protein kinase